MLRGYIAQRVTGAAFKLTIKWKPSKEVMDKLEKHYNPDSNVVFKINREMRNAGLKTPTTSPTEYIYKMNPTTMLLNKARKAHIRSINTEAFNDSSYRT